MTRPGGDQPLADLFASDAEAAVLRVLEASGPGLSAGEVKQALRSGGVAKADADRAWSRIQKRIRAHEHVLMVDNRYRWLEQPRVFAPMEALEYIIAGGLVAARRAQLAGVVRAALSQRSENLATAARHHQDKVDSVRALAELAIEVEELAANEVSADAMIHRVRASVKRASLEPIDHAGQRVSFDRRRHRPIGRSIADAAPVRVVRPGYVWKAPDQDVLIAQAAVQEASVIDA